MGKLVYRHDVWFVITVNRNDQSLSQIVIFFLLECFIKLLNIGMLPVGNSDIISLKIMFAKP